ncbi:phage shock protein A [Paenibacillus vortex V453]|jgi:phage shock protein A|uniref:Phage shock protein A n=2 Tax=Paenibacillus TaxID=44249 RepID=A0A163LQ50_9BACL|nr:MULTISPECIES: PspA/IM30 family protein [Paenibacillus]ANA82241.1 phage shock protein A [Paenibacillus glucanolyticus]AVV59020.1 PspA/IM30 family protein [Paenibacillus glucanolyticus]AWP28188.1 phage shock protein A [Paenibacillus sp. Cedars]EFU41300.1 phage shock protein A [Paenibacillus vortex V453]ETT41664.1 phage shock protein A [Paenibacillus sp. FSL R5-808]|eukprot:TRINITY_DN16152_c0_g1_i1.p2 TRINITY_DN16152_c0_g1~~TRINITY_DN16152_c0_g1_i1.p2  ORF type:complete len:223 (-),score=54.98 TRINITY_DN16152_c0_g1_i1:35-703(-)
MSIFKRLRDLTMSNINAIIDKAEDPIKMTDQYIRDMTEDLEDAEKAVASQIAIEKRFKALYEEQAALVEKRTQQAHTAAQAQNVELARRALEEKKAAEAKRDEYKASYDQNKLAADNLRAKLEEMRKQLTAMKNKRETLVARYNAAKAQTEINKAMNGFGSDTASAGLKRMEEKMLAMEARAEASNEMSTREKSLDEEFENLGKDKVVEDELAALMKQYENK